MKIEFPVLESEPLIYFLLHSGVFVLALASVFFLIGVWMGAVIWGRYKKQLNNARVEIAGQFQEIAVLKRKLAEQSMRTASGPLNPPPALLTEVLPAVGEVFPERLKHETRPPTLSSRPVQAPASMAVLAPPPVSSPPPTAPVQLVQAPEIPAAPLFAPAPEVAPLITLTPTPAPLVPVADAEAHADPAMVPPAPGEPAPAASKRKTTAMRRPTVRVKVRKEPAAPVVTEAAPPLAPKDESLAPPAPTTVPVEPSPAVPPDEPAEEEATPLLDEEGDDHQVTPLMDEDDEDDEVAPFGFLLGEPAELATPSSSNLADIIKNAAANVKSITQPSVTVPAPAPAPPPPPIPEIPSVLPEFDPDLGLVYKIPPTEVDDLTRIKGIASVLEKRLHELGIYTWRQIASWQDSHVREFSSRLSFKDRIVREKWVEQARSLNEARFLA